MGRTSPASSRDCATSPESLIGELRGISRGLRPSVLDDLGLVAATRRLLEDLEKRTGIDTTLGITGAERRLPISVELALFRVAQEAISNAEFHAEPERVAVRDELRGWRCPAARQ